MKDAETLSIVNPTDVLQLQMFDSFPDAKIVARAIARHGKIGVLQANLVKEIDGIDAKQLSRFVGILQKAGAVIQTKNKYLYWAQFHPDPDLLALEKMSAWMNRKQKPLKVETDTEFMKKYEEVMNGKHDDVVNKKQQAGLVKLYQSETHREVEDILGSPTYPISSLQLLGTTTIDRMIMGTKLHDQPQNSLFES